MSFSISRKCASWGHHRQSKLAWLKPPKPAGLKISNLPTQYQSIRRLSYPLASDLLLFPGSSEVSVGLYVWLTNGCPFFPAYMLIGRQCCLSSLTLMRGTSDFTSPFSEISLKRNEYGNYYPKKKEKKMIPATKKKYT